MKKIIVKQNVEIAALKRKLLRQIGADLDQSLPAAS
jgi:hypothetical protein